MGFISPDSDKAVEIMFEKIKEKSNVSCSILKSIQVYHSFDAMSHLFQVVCGLKSMVIGENEILTQVKDAYAISKEFGATAGYLNKFFQLLISTGKS